MNFKKYLMRGGIFGVAGIVSTAVDLGLLWLLTQAGLWYFYSGIIGTAIGGIIHYNLNVVTGNISVAGKVVVGAVCQHPGCTAAAEIQCACGQLLCLEHHGSVNLAAHC